MKRTLYIVIFLGLTSYQCLSQKKTQHAKTPTDSLYVHSELDSTDLSIPYDSTNRIEAIKNIIHLKENVLVLRLKSNENSIKAYERSGRQDLAEKIKKENAERNLKIAQAFKSEFDYCPLLIIYAKNTNDLLNGKENIFLNEKLELDSTIHLGNCDFYFVEYGTVMSNERVTEWKYKGVKHTTESTNPISDHTFFISDKDIKQLKQPFPFYSVVMIDDFNKGARNINLHLWSFFIRNATAERIIEYAKNGMLSNMFYSFDEFCDLLEGYKGYHIPEGTRKKLERQAILDLLLPTVNPGSNLPRPNVPGIWH